MTDPRAGQGGAGLRAPTDADRRALSLIANAGQASAGLLPQRDVERLQHQIHKYESQRSDFEAWDTRRQKLQEAVDSEASAEEDGIPDALKRLWEHEREKPAGVDALDSGQHAAQEARAPLDRNEELLAPVAAVLTAGREARDNLTASLEQRVREATARDALPTWFVWAVGDSPSRASQSEAWLTAGIRLTYFRFRHDITDELLPVGRIDSLPGEVAAETRELLAVCDTLRP